MPKQSRRAGRSVPPVTPENARNGAEEKGRKGAGTKAQGAGTKAQDAGTKAQDVRKGSVWRWVAKPAVLWVVALVVIAACLLIGEQDLLWKVQHSDLFLYTSLFFRQQMVVPGGMLVYLGSFFTQFFFYPWMGVALLCGWWLLLLWLTKRAFRIPDQWGVVGLIPLAILLTTNMCLGYWVYVMKLHGYFFVPTIGTTAAVALLWVFRTLPRRLWLRIAYIVAVVVVGYPLMGFYALSAALLMGVWTWRQQKNHAQNAMLSAAALIAVVAVPLCYYRFVYYQTNLINIFRTPLPDFSMIERYPLFYTPYWLLAVCFLAFVLVFRGVACNASQAGNDATPGNIARNKSRKPLLRWAVQGALAAAMVAGVWHFWYQDENFHHELRMERCIEQADWAGVLDEGRRQQIEPTRAIVMMHNLALSRLGRQCDEMYNFKKGSKRTKTPLSIYMYNTAGRLIYYQYGVLNECHRMCMEQGVKYGWSVELLQYLARCSLLGGETQAVRKYEGLLRKTLFYGYWADWLEQMRTQPGQLAKDKETGPVTHMLHHQNRMGSDDGYLEQYLMTMLSKTDSDDPYFQEQAVLGAMWTRNPDDFWPRIIRYAQLRPKEKMPRIFMEAACLFGHMQQMDVINTLPDKSVLESYNAFMKMLNQYKGKPFQVVSNALYPYFSNTYYYEYFFLKDITYF